MKYFIMLLLCCWLLPPLGCQADNLTQPFSLVPCPVAIVPGTGNFQFTAKTVFAVENEEQAEVVKQFTALFTNAAGFTPRIKTESKKGDVCLLTDASLDSEAYLLEITSKKSAFTHRMYKAFLCLAEYPAIIAGCYRGYTGG